MALAELISKVAPSEEEPMEVVSFHAFAANVFQL